MSDWINMLLTCSVLISPLFPFGNMCRIFWKMIDPDNMTYEVYNPVTPISSNLFEFYLWSCLSDELDLQFIVGFYN